MAETAHYEDLSAPAGFRVDVYAEAASPVYYQPLAELERAGRIEDFGLHSLRIFRPLLKNLLLRGGLIKGRLPEPLSPVDFVDRLSSLRHLRHSDAVVVALEPYDARIAAFLPIKEILLRRGVQVVYWTSWHDWDSGWQPRDPLPFAHSLWKQFLQDVHVVCVSEASAQALRPRARRVSIIPHPVDLGRFYPVENGQQKAPGPFRWASVSRLVEGKGLRELIKIFQQRRPEESHLTIMGDGPLSAELVSLAEGGPITILPYDGKQLPDLLRQQDAFVLNSHRHAKWEELFGMVLVEAMACGLPVVSTDCVGPKEILAAGKNGVLVPQQNSRLLAEAMLALEQHGDRRRELRVAGRAYAEGYCGLKSVADRWLSVLLELPD